MRIDYSDGDSNPGAEAPSGQVSRRIVVLANPGAGNHDKNTVEAIAKNLRGHDCVVDIIESQDANHIHEIARTVDARALLVAGGDGSISDSVGGLLKRARPRPVLGVIPQGTANVLAHDLGLPSDASRLTEVFARDRVAPLHIGVANGRPFVLMASAGFDAEVVRCVDKRLKRLTGGLAYGHAAIRAAFNYVNEEIEITNGDSIFLAKLAIVTNSRCYGGNFVIDRETSALAPGLKLVFARDLPIPALIRLLAALLTGRLGDSSLVERMPARNVKLRARRAVPAQVDGDVLGTTPVEVSECPETIDIFI